LSPPLRLSRIPRVYTQCEDRSCLVYLFVHGHFTACTDFSRDRFRRTDRVSTTKWTGHSCFADLERPLRASHAKRFLQNSGKGTNSLLKHVRQDRRCSREHCRGGRRRGHGGASRRKIHSCTDALFHAVHRSRRNACRVPPRLSGVAWLCPDAGTVRDCILQRSQSWDSGHGAREDANRPLSGAIAADISNGP
jgi:hypothetical protein